ncbi:MAG TPA: universal stress protein [Candidatus Acidoferrum sp.]|nr:universal stress protein [Candidatus Acidoferrum sp.]
MSHRPGFHRILFAVNGSPYSAAAVPVVAAIAGKSQSEVLVVHVWSPDDIRLEDELSRRRNDSPDVSAVVGRLHAAGVAAAGESSGATSESIAAFIVRRADTFDADLIALGNRGLSELHSFLIGSRTQQVLLQATRPVLAVRNVKPGLRGGIRRVVLVLDGSRDDESIVQAGIDIAQPAAAGVEVMDFGNRNAQWVGAVDNHLAKHGVSHTWRHLRDGSDAAGEILGAVHRTRADFVVIAATQSRLRSRLVPGLTAKLLQSCPCALLVAPAHELSKIRYTPLGAAPSGRPGHTT